MTPQNQQLNKTNYPVAGIPSRCGVACDPLATGSILTHKMNARLAGRLIASRGTTQDSHGCELPYRVATTYNKWGEVEERTYTDRVGLNLRSNTLDGLRAAASNI